MSDDQKKTETQSEQIDYEQVFGITSDQLEEIRKGAIEKAKTAKHRWRQRGFWLVCTTCDNNHAVWIQGKEMIGEEENGEPILRVLHKP